MQLLVILLVAVIVGRDALGPSLPWGANVPAWQGWAVAWGAALLLMLVQELTVRRAIRLLDDRRGLPAVMRADRVLRRMPWAALAATAVAVYVFDWVGAVRAVVGDLVIVDELLAMLPPLSVVVAGWWSWYPVERRLRQAAVVRRLDQGLTVHATPSRRVFVIQQTRLHLLLLLVPILLALTLSEGASRAVMRWWPEEASWLEPTASIGAVGLVFVMAPLLLSAVLDVRSLPDGPIRRDLEEVCVAHRVRVADLLVWETGGTMINAAVIGLVAPLRYVLLTDGLLDAMRPEQLEAVMAHEIGHVRRWHMIWLGLALVAAVGGAGLLVDGALILVEPPIRDPHRPAWGDVASVLGSAVIALGLFGFASRRFERQADAFAVAHLSRRAPRTSAAGAPGGVDAPRGPGTDPVSTPSAPGAPVEDGAPTAEPAIGRTEPPKVTADAIAAMCSALDTVAELNNVNPEQKSWRHGSIRWRQRALASLHGRPLTRLPIDRQVRVIQLASLGIVLLVIAIIVFESRTLG